MKKIKYGIFKNKKTNKTLVYYPCPKNANTSAKLFFAKHLGIDKRIIEAPPTDGLWGDGRTDESQIGATYEELEEAMEYGSGPAVETLEYFKEQNEHKMLPIPTFKLQKEHIY